MRIEQCSCDARCRAHKERQGKVYSEHNILPDGICPVLFHSLYPYFLGMTDHVKQWDYVDGTDLIACPALNGVRCVVHRVPHPTKKYEIVARVVEVGSCPNRHKERDSFTFTNTRKDDFMCAAGWFNMALFLKLPEYIKECCADKFRCPDWNGSIEFKVKDGLK